MNTLKKYLVGILALLLIVLAAMNVVTKYMPAKQAYEIEKNNLTTQNMVVQQQVIENQKYVDVQDQLDPALEAIQVSRKELYSVFPVEMKEEDQIMYMLYLEDKFGKEVSFSFTQAETIAVMSDGAMLQGMTFPFEYQTTYAGFKKMVQEIATDDRIASVRNASLNYDSELDEVSGQMVVTVYLMQDGREYTAPAVTTPSTGKDNPYKK